MTLLRILVASLVAWLSLGSPAEGSPLADAPVAAYPYDAPVYNAPGTASASERGPPAAGYADTTHDAVDQWSHGPSACPAGAVSSATYTYDHPVLPVQVASGTSMTLGRAGATAGLPSPLEPSHVAAKTGDDLTRVGRWMPEDELADMQRTGLVQERSGGRTFVTNPADPDAYPAGKGVFAEFDVPTKSLFPAGKPEWSVIPGPNVTTTRFGPPPSQMPPATCIVVVCRR